VAELKILSSKGVDLSPLGRLGRWVAERLKEKNAVVDVTEQKEG
jgi:hypothetical protein